MTTMTISGYSAGFIFHSPYTALSITSTGVVGQRTDDVAIDGQEGTQAYAVTNYGKVFGEVYLGSGGEVTNGSNSYSNASIIGSGVGVFIRNAVGAVSNYGTIAAVDTGTAAGVYLNEGGVITNGNGVDTHATILGSYGVWIRNTVGTVVNFGSILGGNGGDNEAGVLLSNGGLLTNGTGVDTTAVIKGGLGVQVEQGPGTVANFGSILGVTAGGAFGVDLSYGGTLTNGSVNDHVALIGGYETGVEIRAGGTITNYGTIAGDGDANGARSIYLYSGGVLTNGGGGDHSALIEGYGGVEIARATAQVANFGTILAESARGYGLQMGAGGSVTNGAASDTTALIEGAGGLDLRSATGTNLGVIEGIGLSSGVGLHLEGTGASLVNGAAGQTASLIAGYVGAYLSGTSTLTNFGTIEGFGGVAVELAASTDVLQVAAGSVFEGQVTGGGGVLTLITGSGTISGLTGGAVTVSGSMPTTTFTDFGTVGIGVGAKFTLSGSASVAAHETLNVAGGLTAAGAIDVSGELVLTGSLSGTGTLALAGAKAKFATASLGIAKVTLGGATTALAVDRSLSYAGAWSQSAGTVTIAAKYNLTFTGAADSFAGTFAGAGSVVFSGGSDSFNGLTLSAAGATISNAGVVLSGAITLDQILSVTSPKLTISTTGASLIGGGELLLSGVATNAITGAAATATLTNVNDRIVGSGDLGGGKMILVNQSSGTIDGSGAFALTINTGASAIDNAGLIEGVGTGGVIIDGAIDNTGTLLATGRLTVDGAVSGSGSVRISGGTADFGSTFAENVSFSDKGELELARSTTYTGTISGFAKTSATSLDLQDITFGASTKATYSGTATAGTLTVTDGTHTAKIKLVGNYTTSAFTVSSDGHGGTKVVDPSSTPRYHVFIAAMASLGAGASHSMLSGADASRAILPALAAPS